VHGHNWIARVYYDFDSVDERGLTVDYRKLRALVEGVIHPHFDHRHLNDIKPFDTVNPTSENIAAEIFRILKEHIHIKGGTLRAVELWETSKDMVRYSETS
jgi:6-pyruvoyltetrahydropterin/6-carboxytetrahydropterin synthase